MWLRVTDPAAPMLFTIVEPPTRSSIRNATSSMAGVGSRRRSVDHSNACRSQNGNTLPVSAMPGPCHAASFEMISSARLVWKIGRPGPGIPCRSERPGSERISTETPSTSPCLRPTSCLPSTRSSGACSTRSKGFSGIDGIVMRGPSESSSVRGRRPFSSKSESRRSLSWDTPFVHTLRDRTLLDMSDLDR